MIIKILVINQCKFNFSKILSQPSKGYYSITYVKNAEEALQNLNIELADVIFITIPNGTIRQPLFDFISILKQSCKVIPIIGFVEPDKQLVSTAKIDDIVCINSNKDHLFEKVLKLVNIKNLFNEELLSNMYIEERASKNVVIVSTKEIKLFHKNIFDNLNITSLKTCENLDSFTEADLFIISADYNKAMECCISLRLKNSNKYKPIVIAYKKSNKGKINSIIKSNVGYTDIIDLESNDMALACRLTSLIRYKQLYESFLEKLKSSLYTSTVDSTTEVYSRSFFDNYVKNKQHGLFYSAIIMLDIDKFKLINDKFGHDFADSVLWDISHIIKNNTRSSDIVARYGGDEFIILVGNATKIVAKNIAYRIQKAIESCFSSNTKCTASLGLYYIDSKGMLLSEAIHIADKFMYIAKQNGGNSVKTC